MPKTKTTKKRSTTKKKQDIVSSKIQREIIIIGTFVMALLIAASVYTESVGAVGQVIRGLFVGVFGFSSYLVPIYLLVLTVAILFNRFDGAIKVKIIATGVFLIVVAMFSQLIYRGSTPALVDGVLPDYYSQATFSNGGLIGGLLGDQLIKFFGSLGSYLLITALAMIYFVILTEKSIIKIIGFFSKKMHTSLKGAVEKQKETYQKKKEEKALVVKGIEEENKKAKEKKAKDKKVVPKLEPVTEEIEPVELFEGEHGQIQIMDANAKEEQVEESIENKQKPVKTSKAKVEPEEEKQEITIHTTDIPYNFPVIDLLERTRNTGTSGSRNQLIHNAKKLEKALESFGVKAKVVQVNKGPTVTRYELQPSQGVKVSKIVNLTDDIALNLAASGVRIEAPVPGKGVVGIEVANEEKQAVGLREVLDSQQFKKFPSDVAFGLGKDIDGNVIVGDIGKMPHLLIAGATGSGKSVCINTLITSILYKSHPKDVKLILIDPKVVELSVYNGIPHLLIPVVNDPKKAAGALAWAVAEMTTRYKKFAEWNVRDMKGYNNAVKGTEEAHTKMPQIVIIIDELADLMMVSPKDVEEAICRLAQMARAAGINLVIATQRPSVDVITGVIKANIPSRLAFAVSSGTDSRTILDMNGAEKLLGKGDMLFMPIGAQKPLRIQGAFISDKEVENIVNHVKKDLEVDYNNQVIEEISASVSTVSGGGEASEMDEHLEEAIQLVVGKQKASISMLQRTYRIGFNRASRLMESLHERGIVGPEEGSKPRRVLVTPEDLEE